MIMLPTMDRLNELTNDQLNELVAMCEMLQKKRRNERFAELTTAAADALNALRAEFPDVSLRVSWECRECYCYETIDIFEYFDKFKANNFSNS